MVKLKEIDAEIHKLQISFYGIDLKKCNNVKFAFY